MRQKHIMIVLLLAILSGILGGQSTLHGWYYSLSKWKRIIVAVAIFLVIGILIWYILSNYKK